MYRRTCRVLCRRNPGILFSREKPFKFWCKQNLIYFEISCIFCKRDNVKWGNVFCDAVKYTFFALSFLIADSFQLFPLSCLVTWLFHCCTFMFFDFQIEAQMVNGGVFAEPPKQQGIIPFSNTIYRDVSATVKNRISFYLFGVKAHLVSLQSCGNVRLLDQMDLYSVALKRNCTGILFRWACDMFVLNLFALKQGYPRSLSCFLK